VKVLDVRDLRERLGENRDGGTTQPVKAARASKAIQNDLEGPFLLRWEALYPELHLEQQHQFHPVRKWKFDFAAVAVLVAVEIEGGQWTTSRHRTGTGYEEDARKYNSALALGWAVFRLTAGMSRDEDQLRAIAETIRARELDASGREES
jgi:very-short-patch-repair endonuclease